MCQFDNFTIVELFFFFFFKKLVSTLEAIIGVFSTKSSSPPHYFYPLLLSSVFDVSFSFHLKRGSLNEESCLIARIPNHQGWHAKRKLTWNKCTTHTYFRTFRADLYAQSVLINMISAAELSRKFIKSALLVG